ncbi:MAG: CPBP family intramembrane metalloprotease [Planctomycetaceae bacterium]|nr:CPBP family intramembrane metalloprotease [Planctomycetaceae bacterium]
MIFSLNPILAQAAAAPEIATAGSVITAIMFLMTAAGSMAMIVIWVIRYNQSGNALPAARRGVLRVPWPLTIAGILLSALFMLLTLAGSVGETLGTARNNVAVDSQAEAQDTTPEKVDGSVDSQTATTAENIESTSTAPELTANPVESAELQVESGMKPAEQEDAATSKSSSISPEAMRQSLFTTVAMDLLLLLFFGAVILIASQSGRVNLREPIVGSPAGGSVTQSSGRVPDAVDGPGARWPDLDDASAIPQIQGFDVLGPRALNAARTADSPISQDLTPPPPGSTLQPQHYASRTGVHSPIDGSLPEFQALTAEEVFPPDEPFSFVRELRFAGEVFLAAYLPTTALKLLIVLISMAIAGEPPQSHPFLEMLESGVSVTMIAMILIMAVFVAPIVEELQFRVVVLGGIAQLGWPKLALFVSSILFAFAHGFPDSLALIPLAVSLGYAYLRRRSYVTVMLVHFLFNGFNMILALVALL